jgi:succinate dehydrogenase / fumarate reductase iron-sulfur subunit
MDRNFQLVVKRQDQPEEPVRWETFPIPHRPQMNVISCLQYVAAHPVTAEGRSTTPVAWESNCLEEICGACTMIINGRVRQACTALVDTLLSETPDAIRLEPMTKFPVVRDLVVDRSRMFEQLKRVKAWIPVDGYYDAGPGPVTSPADQEKAYPLSQCMTCGCCVEACPQVNDNSDFIGPAAISQAIYFNTNPTGKLNAHERLDALLAPGGISDCGNAQNCVEVCPKEIPLTESIAQAGRDTTFYVIRRWLNH